MSSKVKVMKFSAVWCGPCKAMKPIWDATVKENVNPDIEYVAIDIDDDETTTVKHNIRSVPTTIFFKDGQEVERVSGTIRDIKGSAEKYL